MRLQIQQNQNLKCTRVRNFTKTICYTKLVIENDILINLVTVLMFIQKRIQSDN